MQRLSLRNTWVVSGLSFVFISLSFVVTLQISQLACYYGALLPVIAKYVQAFFFTTISN